MQKTPLASRHEAAGARMIEFAGWWMPVQYTGIIEEHKTVRAGAGLFDLGHMGQVEIGGPDATAFIQQVATNDVTSLDRGQAQYSLLLYPDGGVVDDIIVYRRPSGGAYFVVINAANAAKDVAWLHEQRAARADLHVSIEDVSSETGMIAIQGPKAASIVAKVAPGAVTDMEYFTCRETSVAGVPCLAGRTGYTGEDGWEFFCPIERAGELWDALLEAGQDAGLRPIGLGARDTLRLEARMPLYGNEMSADINPYEAGLGWAVKLDKGDFIGREALLAARERGIGKRAVGFQMVGRGGAPRSHYDVQVDGQTVGFVTSGAPSPTLGENIGLALIDKAYAGVGKPLDIIIRGKPSRAVQVKMPFYKRAERTSSVS